MARDAPVSTRLRRAWRLVALGLAVQAASGIVRVVAPDLSDLVYLSSYPLLLVCLAVALMAGRLGARQIVATKTQALAQIGSWEWDVEHDHIGHEVDHDALTGLYNRRRFADGLDRVLRDSWRRRRPGALVILDIDDFKLVNDAHGHAAGDAALETVADLLRDRVREIDVVGRLGGDEFGIVLDDADEAQARRIAERIRSDLATQLRPPVATSAGIAMFDGTRPLTADDVLVAADVALYEAKADGKDRVCMYDGMATGPLMWVDRIRTALAKDRLVLYGQPIVDVRTGRVRYHELLVRMLSDDGDVILPDAFLPTAERFGLSSDIDRWVVARAMQLAGAGERVSINLSAHSIGDPRIIDAVRDGLARGAEPANLLFEVTETVAVTNMNAAREFAVQLTSLGCSVALDDFGTGFASFSYLKHLPAGYVKIDMEFVRDLVSSPTDHQVVKSITDVAHSLGKQTIAEGVEDEATLDVVRRLGVDCAQGFFFGRPQLVPKPSVLRRPFVRLSTGVTASPSAEISRVSGETEASNVD